MTQASQEFSMHRLVLTYAQWNPIVTDAGWDAVDAAASGTQRDRRVGFGL
jgi:hypothetical protein